MVKVTNISTLSANVEADAFAHLMDGGFIDIYDGVQPKSADEPIAKNQVGVSLKLGLPAFLPAFGGTITANPIAPGVTTASLYPATWARIYRADHKTVVMDVSVGVKDAVIVLPSVNLPEGITVTCSSFAHKVTRGWVDWVDSAG